MVCRLLDTVSKCVHRWCRQLLLLVSQKLDLDCDLDPGRSRTGGLMNKLLQTTPYLPLETVFLRPTGPVPHNLALLLD